MTRRVSEHATRTLGTSSDPKCAPGPIPGVVGRALGRLYGIGVRIDQQRKAQPGRVQRLPVPVVSVGNLTVGGTGKTPMVAWVVRTLHARGLRPAVALRGYRARRGFSDEADEHARAFAGMHPPVPILADPDRAGAVRALLEHEPGACDCVVLDDGFQHRRVARVLDIVLIDCGRPSTRDRLLPAGWLRVPIAEIARAGAVVLTHAELTDESGVHAIASEVVAAGGPEPIAVCRHGWGGLFAADGDARGVEDLAGRRVVACCAIGQPGGFLRSVRHASGGSLVGELILRDHDPFEPATVERLITLARGARAERIVVTEKDWSKLRRVAGSRWPCDVVRPRLELVFDRGEAELGELVHGSASMSGDP